MFSVLLKGESIPSVSIPKAEKSEFSPFQIFRGIQACTKSQPSGEPQALAECPAPCSCCQSLHGQWKASCSHCSKVVLQPCSPPPEECCKPEEMFSFLYVILVSQSWTYWYRACVCDKVVPHQYSSVITSQSKHYWNSFSSVLLLFFLVSFWLCFILILQVTLFLLHLLWIHLQKSEWMTVEKQRDASGQSLIKMQVPLHLQMLTDCIQEFDQCSIFIWIFFSYLGTYSTV